MIEVNDMNEFSEVLKNNENVVLEFYHDDCGACKSFWSTVNDIKSTVTNTAFVKMNVFNKGIQPIRDEYEVERVPFIVGFKNGETKKVVNASLAPRELKKFINDL